MTKPRRCSKRRNKMRKIFDKYTNLPLSRQYKWQLRHKQQHLEYRKKLMKRYAEQRRTNEIQNKQD